MGVTIATEGLVDEAVAKRLLRERGLEAGDSYVRRGKTDLDPRLPSYGRAADHWPWLVLRDFDGDAPCAPALVSELVPHPGAYLCFRVPVPQVEAWLMADHRSLGRFLLIPAARVPSQPERLHDAKAALVDLSRASRSSRLRAEMVPRVGSGAKVGPGYNARLVEFVIRHWEPERAATRSPSLTRARAAIANIRYPV